MKKKILVITLALSLVLTSACGSKGDSKDKKDKDKETTGAIVVEDTSDKVSEEASDDPTEEVTKATDATEAVTEATTTEATTETTEETTTAVPTETTERDESECIFDLTGMTAEEIADFCDSLTQREIPKVGDLYSEVQKNYYDVEPWRYTQAFCGRYGRADIDNVNCIYVSGVFIEGTEEQGGPFIRSVELFGTGIVLEIYDYAKAEEFIKIMKERHPVIEEKPGGSWKGEDFVVGLTPIDYITYANGIHFQIAYGEKSSWYESVASVFGFGMEITLPSGETDPASETTV